MPTQLQSWILPSKGQLTPKLSQNLPKIQEEEIPDLFYEPRMSLIQRQTKILHGKKTLDKNSPDSFQQSLPRVRSQGSDPFICLNVLIDDLGFEVG